MAPIYTAMGSETIEKHIKLEGDYNSIDAEFSLSSDNFLRFTNGIREAQKIRNRDATSITNRSGKQYHRSYYYKTSLTVGTQIKRSHLISLRPNSGLSTFEAADLIGKKLSVNVQEYDAVDLSHVK